MRAAAIQGLKVADTQQLEINRFCCDLKVEMLGFPNQFVLESETKRNIKEGSQALGLRTREVAETVIPSE